MQPAYKIVIITEKIICDDVTDLIQSLGAAGFTMTSAGGKGSRGIRGSERNSIHDANANVKIEAIVTDLGVAEKISHAVTEDYLANYSGIAYLEDVKILRPQKFS